MIPKCWLRDLPSLEDAIHDIVDAHIVKHLLHGALNIQIAEDVFLSVQTVNNRISQMIKRTHSKNQTELAMLFTQLSAIPNSIVPGAPSSSAVRALPSSIGVLIAFINWIIQTTTMMPMMRTATPNSAPHPPRAFAAVFLPLVVRGATDAPYLELRGGAHCGGFVDTGPWSFGGGVTDDESILWPHAPQ